jgi:DNA mismatch repair ATPase MutS
MKAHLLFQDQDFDFEASLPPQHEALIQDLELKTLLGAMAAGDAFLLETCARVVVAGLDEPEPIAFRQRVLADCITNPDVVRTVYAISVAALEDRRGLWGFSSRYPRSILSAAVQQLELQVGRLKQLRRLADDNVDRFTSKGLLTLFHTLQDQLDDAYLQAIDGHLKRLRFQDGELMSAQLDRDNNGVEYVLRSTGSAKSGWRQRFGLAPRSSYSFTIAPRDEAGADFLSGLVNRGINLAADAAAQSSDHITSYFRMLRAEMGFYIGCLNLRDQLAAKGESLTFPEPVRWKEPLVFSASGLRDPCLALRHEGPIVGNDIQADGKSLVVVTGANSGGKSTFLRSVGLAHLMMQCGMFVDAEAFRAAVTNRVFTHFIREEDEAMTSGRLDEELRRMSEIADSIGPHCLMLFNESFASTNEREGSEIARQVVRALLDAGVRVFFVTHQFDFAESVQQLHSTSTLFLRAERNSDGTRSYKLIVADPLPTSFGEDLYRQLGGWLEEDRRLPVSSLDGLVSPAATGTGGEQEV